MHFLFYFLGQIVKWLQKNNEFSIFNILFALGLPLFIQLYGLKINFDGTKIISPTVLIFIFLAYFIGLKSGKIVNGRIVLLLLLAILSSSWILPNLNEIIVDREVSYRKEVKKIDSLYDKNGNVLDFSRLKNKILIINFWDSSCSYCFQKIPFLVELQKKTYLKDIIFLNINTGNPDNFQTFKKSAKKFPENNNFLTLYDSTAVFSKEMGVIQLPKEFIIDKSLIVKYENEGFPDIEHNTYVSSRENYIKKIENNE